MRVSFIMSMIPLLLTLGCISPDSMADKTSRTVIPFNFVEGDTAILVPVTLNGTEHVHMILDTGAGVEVISNQLGQKLQLMADQEFTARRLTNEPMTIKLGRVESISFGPITKKIGT